jgi:hypothetical protein
MAVFVLNFMNTRVVLERETFLISTIVNTMGKDAGKPITSFYCSFIAEKQENKIMKLEHSLMKIK